MSSFISHLSNRNQMNSLECNGFMAPPSALEEIYGKKKLDQLYTVPISLIIFDLRCKEIAFYPKYQSWCHVHTMSTQFSDAVYRWLYQHLLLYRSVTRLSPSLFSLIDSLLIISVMKAAHQYRSGGHRLSFSTVKSTVILVFGVFLLVFLFLFFLFRPRFSHTLDRKINRCTARTFFFFNPIQKMCLMSHASKRDIDVARKHQNWVQLLA